jgi:hypothetical protein
MTLHIWYRGKEDDAVALDLNIASAGAAATAIAGIATAGFYTYTDPVTSTVAFIPWHSITYIDLE